MRMHITGILVLATLGSSLASAQDPRRIHMLGPPEYGGTGCPDGTMRAVMSADGESMTLIFDQYVASIGPGIPITENRKNCVINVRVHVPNGLTFAIASVDYRGFMSLDPFVTGTQQSTYWFMGDRPQSTKRTVFVGPREDDYLESDEFELASLVWSPCGVETNLNLNSQIRLAKLPRASRNAQGVMTTDTIDGKVETRFNFMIRRCRQ